MATRVVNINSPEWRATPQHLRVLITRPSIWGNPYTVPKFGTREEVIDRYRLFLERNTKLHTRLRTLVGKTLGCVCKPLPCHGNLLVDIVNRLYPEDSISNDTTC